jgi:hypothetical protein
MTRYFSALSMLTFSARPFFPPIFFIPPFVLTLRAPSSSRIPFSHPFISSPSSSFQSTFIFSHLFSPPIFFISNYLPVFPTFRAPSSSRIFGIHLDKSLPHAHGFKVCILFFRWKGRETRWDSGDFFDKIQNPSHSPRHFPPSALFCEM